MGEEVLPAITDTNTTATTGNTGAAIAATTTTTERPTTISHNKYLESATDNENISNHRVERK
ncbi:MAG: hypothetical protein QW518_08920, partial [Thermofilaceae archaeon]